MSYSPLLIRLIDSLRCMPGVGRKSAQRIAFHLLERDREGASMLSSALADAVEGMGRCSRCRMLTEHDLCAICSANGRDATQLCVVESPADVMAELRGLEDLPEEERAERKSAAPTGLSPTEGTLWPLLKSSDPLSIDELIDASGLPPAQVAAGMLTLEMKALTKSLPGKRYVRIDP